jgi:hypothetical protein
MMCLGLDLGTGQAKLARYPAGTGGEPVITVAPTAVAYQGLASEIPVGRGHEPLRSGAVRCDGFVPMLGTALSASRVAAWRNRTPGEAAQGFLRCLLDQVDGGQRAEPAAESGGLVVAVPAAARHDAAGGPSAGSEVADILTALGWAPRRLVATPVAALLQLRHDDPELAGASRFVVIDAGAGSVDLSLCTATGAGLRVADSIRLVGGSAWADDTLLDMTWDRPPTLAEHLVTAMAAAAGAPRAPVPGPVSVDRWRALECELADQAKRDRLEAALRQAAAARHRHGDTVAVSFADLEVTASQFLDACEPLARRSAAALDRLLGRQAEPGWRPAGADGTRVVLTGGLAMLHPLRIALLASLGLDPDRPGRAVVQPSGIDRLCAPARGAALLAAGQADPGDRYPHGLRLLVSRVVRDRLVIEYPQLAVPGAIDLDGSRTVYLTEPGDSGGGRPVQVTVRAAAEAIPPGTDPPDVPPIPVQIVPADGGEAVPAAFRPAPPPVPGVYQVGVRGGLGGPVIVLQPTDGSQALIYPLAAPADLMRDRRPAGIPAGEE